MNWNRIGDRWVWVLLLCLCLTWCSVAEAAKIPVILSTDVGNEIDDQWVVAYLLTDPGFDVIGIVSAHAPTLPPPSAHTTYMVLLDEVENRLKMGTHPPLFEGSSVPLEEAKTPLPNAGVDFIIGSSKKFSKANRLNVLMIGAATDVASAILKDPSIVDRIRVVAMGFKNWPEGGDEFNVMNDVKAWQAILASNVPVVVGSAEVCRKYLSLTPDQARILISSHGPIGGWLWKEYLAWYYRFVKPIRKNDFSKPWIIWDDITVAFTLGMTKQEVYPRPVLNDKLRFDHPQTERTITWITAVDQKRMWTDFVKKLDTYQRTHGVGIATTGAFLPQ